MTTPPLRDLLVEHRADLLRYVERRAGRLLRLEPAEDLLQGIHLRALQQEDAFVWRGREPFFAWLHQVARSHLADRHLHWAALRRRPERLMRLTRGGTSAGAAPRGAREPAFTGTGPATHASRREELDVALRALAVLLPRDRDLVRWSCEDVDPDEQARRLDVSREAADRARRRALERFRKAFELASRG